MAGAQPFAWIFWHRPGSCLLYSDYTDQPSAEGFVVSQLRPAERIIDAERFEWRVLNRLLGFFGIGLEAVSYTAITPTSQAPKDLWSVSSGRRSASLMRNGLNGGCSTVCLDFLA